jgi:hypothetical protein
MDLHSGYLVSLSALLAAAAVAGQAHKGREEKENRVGLRLFGEVRTRVVIRLSCVRALLTWHG